MSHEARIALRALLGEAAMLIEAQGIPLPPELKRRDPREPRRREKERLEDRLIETILRHWRRQRVRIRERLELYFPNRKQAAGIFDELFWEAETDDLVAHVIPIIEEGRRRGVALFSEQTRVGLDYGAVNERALAGVAEHVGLLVKGITETTRATLVRAVENFIATPGFTIGDIVRALPYDEVRAELIAITEVTEAYATAAQEAGEYLREEFPGVAVIKTWFTNQDERVCPVCEPLDGESVDVEAQFVGGDGELYDYPPAHPNCRCWMDTTTDILAGEE